MKERVALSVRASLFPSEDFTAKEQFICGGPREWR